MFADTLNQLSASVGYPIHSPQFWQPLMWYGLFFIIIFIGLLFEAYHLSLSLLAPFTVTERTVYTIKPWQQAFSLWIIMALGFFIWAFPQAWIYMVSLLMYPLSLLGVAFMLRTISYEIWQRHPDHEITLNVFIVSNAVTVFVYGWILGLFTVNFQAEIQYQLYALLIGFCAFPFYALLGACWLIYTEKDSLQYRAIFWAKYMIRPAALAVAIQMTALVIANPGILNRWVAYARLITFIWYWIIILIAFVVLELTIRHCEQSYIKRPLKKWVYKVPLILLLVMLFIIFTGILYSYFPFLIYGEINIWNAI